MALSKPFEVKIWTSSHGTSYHHFPLNLEKAFRDSTNEKKDSLIQSPCVNAIPGRCLTKRFVEEVKTDLEKSDPLVRQMNIILMGDNDVRSLAFSGSYRVVSQIGKLIELHENTQNALILCGLLPSPATHMVTARLFDYTSSNIRNLCDEAHTTPRGRFISYLKLSHLFNDQDGLIDYLRYFEEDGVHLNPTGAYRLAQYLVHHAMDFADSCQMTVGMAYLDLQENFLTETSRLTDSPPLASRMPSSTEN